MFLSDTLDAWVHIYFLPRIQSTEEIYGDGCVVPSQVVAWVERHMPLSFFNSTFCIFFKIFKFPIAPFASRFLDNIIASLFHINLEFGRFLN